MITATVQEKSASFEWLRRVAISHYDKSTRRAAQIMLMEVVRYRWFRRHYCGDDAAVENFNKVMADGSSEETIDAAIDGALEQEMAMAKLREGTNEILRDPLWNTMGQFLLPVPGPALRPKKRKTKAKRRKKR
jgi:hypothetical protein